MRLLIGLVIAIAFVALFRRVIKAAPIAFYALATLAVIFYLYGAVYGLPAWLWKTVMFLLQKNIFAIALFAIVMFIGVLPNDSALRKALMPIRGELSIVACILSIGHMLVFGYAYFGRMLDEGSSLPVIYLTASFSALALACIMLPLLLTSFRTIRSCMSSHAWKRVQWLAYPFFVLTFVHIFLFIAPSSLQGGAGAAFNVLVYGFVFVCYLVLRGRKAVLETRSQSARSQATTES